jgi:phage head maturation protease
MTDTGKKAMELMRDGVIDEMSIGYDIIKDEYKGKNRMLK